MAGEMSGQAAEGAPDPASAHDVLGRPVVTAAEMAAMAPEELERLHIQRTVTELGALPEKLLARLLPSEDELTIRSARLRGPGGDRPRGEPRVS